MNKYDLEDFKKVWKESSKEGILNQFYYEHIELEQLKSNWNSLREDLKRYDLTYLHETGEHQLADVIEDILDKMNELEEVNNKWNIG